MIIKQTCKVYQNKYIKDDIAQEDTYNKVDWSIYHDIDFGYVHLWFNKIYLGFSYYHTSYDSIHDHFYFK